MFVNCASNEASHVRFINELGAERKRERGEEGVGEWEGGYYVKENIC